MRLQNKTALVTGAASGFGEGIAKTFAREGARVAVVDINESGVEAVAAAIGDAALPIVGDVAKGSAVQAAVDRALQTFGRLDIVVNNAGVSHKNSPMLDVDEAEFDRVYAINVKSIFHMAHAIVPVMRRDGGGVIINITSTAGIRPRPGLTWYNGSKGAANVITKTMAVELAPDNIRVCGIAPVMGETGLLETFMGMPDTPENRKKFVSTIPLGRMSQPRDIANVALHLASDDSDFLTGILLEVDGGRCV
ncbi:MAG: glucose 1-dehydrogenase [Alphaproteobacteria bacterium]|nr:glucose 1-dehydrogenase [Alphaproteobacteria bacterium]